MPTSTSKLASVFSWLIVVLAIIATIGGLFIPGLYRDTEFYKTAWQGNDFVTLVVVVPVLIIVLFHVIRGSHRAQLIWLGLLLYIWYNYAFYLFGAAFNVFFLLYVALFTLAMYAFFLVLYNLDIEAIHNSFTPDTPVSWISGFLIFLAVPLLIVEGGQSLNFIFTGKLPSSPSLIFALDLSFVVPGMITGAILLWQRRSWGFIFAAIMLVKGVAYGGVLVVNTALLTIKHLAPMDPLMPFYTIVAFGSLIFSILLLKNLKTT